MFSPKKSVLFCFLLVFIFCVLPDYGWCSTTHFPIVNLEIIVDGSAWSHISFSNDNYSWSEEETIGFNNISIFNKVWNLMTPEYGGTTEDGTKCVYFRLKNNVDQVWQESSCACVHFLSGYDYIYFEAEDTNITTPMQVGADSRASGGEYIFVPEGTGDSTVPVAAATYDINIPVEDHYHLWLLMQGPIISSDALYIGFDGNYDRVYSSQWSNYEWVQVEVSDDTNNYMHTLAPGTHQINISHGEELVRADRVLLTNDLDFVPPPLAPLNLTAAAAACQVDLSWADNSSNETGFIIERKENSQTWDQAQKYSVAADVKSYQDTNGLQAGIIYNYRVYAFNDDGNSVPSNENNVATASNIYYQDADLDGYGNPAVSINICEASAGYVLNNNDCDDSDATINPTTVWYKDADGDGYADGTITLVQCERQTNYFLTSELKSISGDCNDNDSAINQGSTEICDGLDNNCDNSVDEGVAYTYYRDMDNDGYGDQNEALQTCSALEGYVSNDADCNDNNADIYPGAVEVCDSIDNNCNNLADEDLTSCNDTAIIAYWRFDEGSGNTVYDESANCYDGIVSGASWISDGQGSVLEFDGYKNHIQIGDIGKSSPTTIAFWVYSKDIMKDRRLLSQTAGSTSQGGALRYNNLQLQVWNGTSWGTIITSGLETNTWQHIAVVYDGTNATAYLNGEIQGSYPSSFDFKGIDAGLAANFLCRYGRPLDGIFGEFTIYGRILTANEIINCYNGK